MPARWWQPPPQPALETLANPHNSTAAGIPDGTHKLATKYGLVPYTDALEEVDAGDLPALAPAFGASPLAGGEPCSGGNWQPCY